MRIVCLSALIFSIAGFSLVFILYPLLLFFLGCFRRKAVPADPEAWPSVSLITVVRNAEDLISGKIENTLALDYPPDKLEMVVFSDGGPIDATTECVGRDVPDRVRFFESSEHSGKNACLNLAVREARGDILVFSDADAQLDKSAIKLLLRWFSDSKIGGVVGRRVIAEKGREWVHAQEDYIRLDSAVKVLESRIGSVSSNDGKLYAVRANLWHPFPLAVTDDLFS